MITKANRPEGWEARDTLAAVIAAAASDLGIPNPFRMATEACRPLYMTPAPTRAWYPGISRDHARAAIAKAGEMLRDEGVDRPEYDFICDKLRRVLWRTLPGRQMTAADLPEFTDAEANAAS